MGAAGSVASMEVPEQVDAEAASRLLGEEFDREAFDSLATDGLIAREVFLEALADQVEEEGERVFDVVQQTIAKVLWSVSLTSPGDDDDGDDDGGGEGAEGAEGGDGDGDGGADDAAASASASAGATDDADGPATDEPDPEAAAASADGADGADGDDGDDADEAELEAAAWDNLAIAVHSLQLIARNPWTQTLDEVFDSQKGRPASEARESRLARWLALNDDVLTALEHATALLGERGPELASLLLLPPMGSSGAAAAAAAGPGAAAAPASEISIETGGAAVAC